MQFERHWMIWDGECGLCSTTARWVRKKDRKKQFQIVTYQNCPRPPMTDDLYERCKTEMYVVTKEGKELGGANGVLFALQTVSWGWFAAVWRVPPFLWLASGVYRLVARNRGWISQKFFGGVACGLDNRYPEVD